MTENTEVETGGSRERPGSSASGWSYRPRLDVTEDADEFTVCADMPGATAEGIQVDFADQTLTIHGTVQTRQSHDTEYLTHEYGVGDFDRELVLSDQVDADRISAEYQHGVLTVHLPKSEQARPRRVPVRAV